MRTKLLGVTVVAVALSLALAACAPTPIKASVLPGSSSPSPSPSVSHGVQPSTTASVPPKAAGVVLSGKAVGDFALGTGSVSDALPSLLATLGKQDDTMSSSCEASGDSRTGYRWKGLIVEFDAKSGVLRQWSVRPGMGVPTGVTLQTGDPFDPTLAAAKQKYPQAKLTDVFATGVGPWLLQVEPDGLAFLWEQDKPKDTDKAFEALGPNPNLCE